MTSDSKPTVVLVHGAWGDATAWDEVIRRLHADGYPSSPRPTPCAASPPTPPTSPACWTRSRAGRPRRPLLRRGGDHQRGRGRPTSRPWSTSPPSPPMRERTRVPPSPAIPGSQVVPPGLPGRDRSPAARPAPRRRRRHRRLHRRRPVPGDLRRRRRRRPPPSWPPPAPGPAPLLRRSPASPPGSPSPPGPLVATRRQHDRHGQRALHGRARRGQDRRGRRLHAALVSRPAEVANLIRTVAGAACARPTRHAPGAALRLLAEARAAVAGWAL